MTDADREFGEHIAADRRQVLSRCRAIDQAKVGIALDRLIEFSRLHKNELEPIDTTALDKPSIGFKLRVRDQVLWKVYAEPSKLEVLIRCGKSLTPPEYAEFLATWRLIPGQQKKPTNKDEVPTISAGAAATELVWIPLRDCLEWAVALPAKA